mgnify:CR=1 FL=1
MIVEAFDILCKFEGDDLTYQKMDPLHFRRYLC